MTLHLASTETINRFKVVNSTWRARCIVIFEDSGLFCRFYSILMENHVRKQCKPLSDATLCGVRSGSALFAYYPFTVFQVRIG